MSMITSRDLIRKEMNVSHTYHIDLHIYYESYFLYRSIVIYCKMLSKWLWTDLSKKKAQAPSEKTAQLLTTSGTTVLIAENSTLETTVIRFSC